MFAVVSGILIGLQYFVLAAAFLAFVISVLRPATLWTHAFGLQLFAIGGASLILIVGFTLAGRSTLVTGNFAAARLTISYAKTRPIWILPINAVSFLMAVALIVLEGTSGVADASASRRGKYYLENSDHGTHVVDQFAYLHILTVHNLWYPLSSVFFFGSLAVTIMLAVRSAAHARQAG